MAVAASSARSNRTIQRVAVMAGRGDIDAGTMRKESLRGFEEE
jgi:hypothetical protein